MFGAGVAQRLRSLVEGSSPASSDQACCGAIGHSIHPHIKHGGQVQVYTCVDMGGGQ